MEVEEGELVGKKLSLHTQALARPSFAKEPHVKEVWSAVWTVSNEP